jgi:hypothetical protein
MAAPPRIQWPHERRGLGSRLGRGLEVLAVLVAVGMLLFRFAHFDLVPFILDEPQFLRAAHGQLGGGHWLSASPLVGTQGVTYGPSVLWFYGAVQKVLGPAPRRDLMAMCVLVTLSHGAFAFAVSRMFRGGALLFAALLALVAASPYQFFWSRLAWDQLVNVCAAWTVVLLCAPGPLGWGRRLALGAVLGLAISSHLMVVPLVALTFAVLGLERLREPRALLATLVPMLGMVLLVNLPYLLYLRAHPPPALPPVSQPFSWELWRENLWQPARVATAAGLDYFFDGAWEDFLGWSGPVGRLFRDTAWMPLALSAVSALGLGLTLGAKQSERRRLAGLGLLAWLGYSLFYTYRVLERHPHYQFPTWWLVGVGVAGLLAWLGERAPAVGTLATGVVFLAALAQFALVERWMGYIQARGGTQGVHYSVPLGAQRRVLREACTRSEGQALTVWNLTALFPQSLDYVAWTTPECEGKQVQLCRQCPARGTLFRLRYASPGAGAVVLE